MRSMRSRPLPFLPASNTPLMPSASPAPAAAVIWPWPPRTRRKPKKATYYFAPNRPAYFPTPIPPKQPPKQ